jgi:hypothetical protein
MKKFLQSLERVCLIISQKGKCNSYSYEVTLSRGCNDVGIPQSQLCLYKAGVGATDKISTEQYNYSSLCVAVLNKLRAEAPEDSCMKVSLKNVTSFYYVMQDGRAPVGFPFFTVTSSKFLGFLGF